MRRPYVFRFEELIFKRVNELPSWSRYTLKAAHHRSLKTFDGAGYASQRLHMPPFHVELFEIKALSPARIHYEMEQKQFFLLFMLEGTATFTTREGLYVSHARNNSFCLSVQDRGHYVTEVPTGRHTILCITLQAEWLSFFVEDQPTLRELLRSAEELSHDHLPYCSLDRQASRWLTSLYKEARLGQGTLDGHLRYFISLILERYHQQVALRVRSLPWKAKCFLDLHYRDPQLSVRGVAKQLDVSDRLLHYQFKTEFRSSVHHYYTCRRVALASRLIREEGRSLSDIYLSCGYNDESTCRYALRKFGLPPT